MAGTASGSAANKTLQARMVLAWMKTYLEGDKRYEEYIYGAKTAEIMSKLSALKSVKK